MNTDLSSKIRGFIMSKFHYKIISILFFIFIGIPTIHYKELNQSTDDSFLVTSYEISAAATSSCPSGCSNHGLCNGNSCVCSSGWMGATCSQRTCPDNCSGNGTCAGTVCRCRRGWVGNNCSIPFKINRRPIRKRTP